MNTRNGLGSLFSETVVYSVANVISRFAPLIFLPLYTRILSPADFGVLSAVFTLSAVVGIIAGLQLESSLFRWFVEHEGNLTKQRSAVASAFWCQLGIAAVVTLAVILTRNVIGSYIHPEQPTVAGNLIAMSVGALFFATAENTTLSLFRIQRRKSATFLVAILGVIANLAATIYFVVFLDWRLFGIVLSLLVAAIAKALFFLIPLNGWVSPLRFDIRLLRDMLGYALPLIPAGLFLWVIALIDRLFLVQYSTLSDAGLYQVAANLSTGVAIVVTGFLQAWTPYAFSIRENANSRKLYAAVFEIFIVFGCFLSIVSSIFAPEALAILATPPFYPASQNVGVLCLAFVLQGVYQISGLGLALERRTQPILYATGIAALINVFLNLALIPHFGRFGAAWATFLSVVTIPLVLFPIAQRTYFIPYNLPRGTLFMVGSLVIIELSNLISWPETIIAFIIKFALVTTLALGAWVFQRRRWDKGVSQEPVGSGVVNINS